MIIKDVTGFQSPLDRAARLCKESHSGKALKACLRGVTMAAAGIYSSKGIPAACEGYKGKARMACHDGAENYMLEARSRAMDGRKKKRGKAKKSRR